MLLPDSMNQNMGVDMTSHGRWWDWHLYLKVILFGGCLIIAANVVTTTTTWPNVQAAPAHAVATATVSIPTATNNSDDATTNAAAPELCLQHPLIRISSLDEDTTRTNAPGVPVTAGGVFLLQPTSTCGTLRRRLLWENRSAAGLELTPLALEIEQHLSNCSLPVGFVRLANQHGLGAHLHQWSQIVCYGQDTGQRLHLHFPEWRWLDEAYCPQQELHTSISGESHLALGCYFPSAEPICPTDKNTSGPPYVADTNFITFECERVSANVTTYRAASTEYLFRQVSPLVLREAERQVGLLFSGGFIPDNMITVHIRWGDKGKEMQLVPIQEYISAVNDLVTNNDTDPTTRDSVHIFLATEDPAAVAAFKSAAPSTWNIYVDRTVTELASFRPDKGNHASVGSRVTKGRYGLVALGSLLVALEANRFVLTTGSNWSRLINELRKNVLDRACDGCTRMLDLRYGELR